MPSDASIYSLIQTPKQELPLDTAGKAMTIRAMMNQNALSGIQQQQAGLQLDEQQRLRQLFANNPNPSVGEVMGASPTAGMKYQQYQLENKLNQAKLTNEQQTAVLNATKMHRDDLANVNDPQTAAAWVTAGYKDPVLGPIMSQAKPLEQALAGIPTDPNKFQQWKQQNALGATKFMELNKPTVKIQNTGDKSSVISIPGLGGTPQTISSTPMQATPRERMADLRARELNGLIEGSQMSQNADAMADAIAHYKLAPLSGFALRSPAGQRIMGLVVQKNPEYNAQNFTSSQKAYSAFMSGPQGNTIRFFGTGLRHLDTLSNLANALQNGDTPMVNKIANYFATQTGGAAPTTFDAAKQIVGNEIVKAITGAGGGVGDREKAQETVANANSPAQLATVINTYKELMAGQLIGLKKQYEVSTMRDDFDKLLSPESQKVLQDFTPKEPVAGSQTAPQQGGGQAPQNAVASTPNQKPAYRIKNDDGYNALPSGAIFIGPDGKTRRKP